MNNLRKPYDYLIQRFGKRRVSWVGTLVLIALASLTIRCLIYTGLDHSALLYVLVPYSCALLIALLRPMQPGQHWWRSYLDFSLTSLVVFLGSSIVLFEGFVCVALFLPIYFAIVTLVFLCRWLVEVQRNHKARQIISVIPLLVIMASVEGVLPITSFARDEVVRVAQILPLPAHQVIERLEQPVDLDQQRHWLLSLFPAPEPLPAQRLVPGAIHEVSIIYPRWFVTNVHRGMLKLQIESVHAQQIRTSVVSDTTLFSNYMTLQATDIQIEPRGSQHSQLTMTVRYQRKLDPSWYFGPLMRFGVTQMADFLLRTMIVRPTATHNHYAMERQHG